MEQTNSMSFLDETGDVEVKWNPDSPWEVHEAKKQFDRLVKEKGYRGFKVGKDGKRSEMIHEFDPQAKRIVMAPASKVAVAGG